MSSQTEESRVRILFLVDIFDHAPPHDGPVCCIFGLNCAIGMPPPHPFQTDCGIIVTHPHLCAHWCFGQIWQDEEAHTREHCRPTPSSYRCMGFTLVCETPGRALVAPASIGEAQGERTRSGDLPACSAEAPLTRLHL